MDRRPSDPITDEDIERMGQGEIPRNMEPILHAPPPPIGYLRIDGGPPEVGGLYWSMMHKPKRRHLWAMRLVFGWRWCDEVGDG